jgi:TPR repeat protein
MLNSLRQLAKRGNLTAALLVGIGDMYGWDAAKANADLEFVRISARSGDPVGLFVLAYKLGAQKETFSEALALAEKAAAAGIAEAASLAGHIGIDLSVSPSESLSWFRKAGEMGDPRGYFWIATKFPDGNGSENINPEVWLEKGVAGGDVRSMYALAQIYLKRAGAKDVGRGVELLKHSAQCGYVYSIMDLAELYRVGANSVPKDTSLAASWTERVDFATQQLHLFNEF